MIDAVTKIKLIFIFGKIKLKLKNIIGYFPILQYFNVCTHRIKNPTGPLLVTTQGKPQDVFSLCLVKQGWQVRFPASHSLSDET